MSTEVHEHVSRRREQRRFIVDIVLVLLFLCAIFGAIIAHIARTAHEQAVLLESERLIREEHARADAAEARRKTVQEEWDASMQNDPRYNVPATSAAPLFAPDPSAADSVLGSSRDRASTSAEIASSTKAETRGFIRFEDVTVTRVENRHLGFLMELPEGWSLAYERSDNLAFANSEYYFGVTDGEIAQKNGAMWLRVIRPCTSGEATTTIFRFTGETLPTSNNIREATACVAPFLVTVGYRDDVEDRLARELFLLSVARTLYPIVSPTAPYAPI